jgi:hypothetical protein
MDDTTQITTQDRYRQLRHSQYILLRPQPRPPFILRPIFVIVIVVVVVVAVGFFFQQQTL